MSNELGRLGTAALSFTPEASSVLNVVDESSFIADLATKIWTKSDYELYGQTYITLITSRPAHICTSVWFTGFDLQQENANIYLLYNNLQCQIIPLGGVLQQTPTIYDAQLTWNAVSLLLLHVRWGVLLFSSPHLHFFFRQWVIALIWLTTCDKTNTGHKRHCVILWLSEHKINS